MGIVEDCAQGKVWRKGRVIGQGNQGSAYVACKAGDGCKYIMKVMDANRDFYVEVQALQELQHTGVVPKIYAAWTCKQCNPQCKHQGFFIMETLNTLDQCDLTAGDHKYKTSYNFYEVRKALDKCKRAGWLHIDTHYGNVMCKGKQIMLIDWGWGVKKGRKSYPDHPMSKKANYAFSYNEMQVVQNHNVDKYWNPLYVLRQKGGFKNKEEEQDMEAFEKKSRVEFEELLERW